MPLLFEFPHALGTGIIISSKSDEGKHECSPLHYDSSQANYTCLYKRLAHIISDFDSTFSRFREDSIVSRIARGDFDGREELDGEKLESKELDGNEPSVRYFIQFPAYTSHLFDIYDALFSISQGRFSPAVADNLISFGYGHDWSNSVDITHAQWGTNVFRSATNSSRLNFLHPVHLDFGAAGKGLLIDLIAQELYSFNVQKFTINAGGDLYTTEQLRIAMENPWDIYQAIGTIDIPPSSALCASAPSRRHWTTADTAQEVHHLIDALTGQPVQRVKATWVWIDNSSSRLQCPTAWADALSTALFMCEPQNLLNARMPLADHTYELNSRDIPLNDSLDAPLTVSQTISSTSSQTSSPWQFARIMDDKSAQQSVNWPGAFFTS